jgi:hypothetical protein
MQAWRIRFAYVSANRLESTVLILQEKNITLEIRGLVDFLFSESKWVLISVTAAVKNF